MIPAWRAFCPAPDPGAVAEAALGLAPGADDVLLVLVAEGGAPELEGIVGALAATGTTFLGGLFPELLLGGSRQASGVLLLRLRGIGAPIVVRDLGDAEEVLAAATERMGTWRDANATAIVLVDGLAPNLTRFLETTYSEFGTRVRYWGGGAGSASFQRKPCLFTGGGVFQGGGIVVLSALQADLGVRHGWRPFKGPLVATRTEGNTVHQLNWERAIDVYGRHVGADLDGPFPSGDIGKVTPAYPLGLQKQGAEFVVRDPVATDASGALLCVGDVPENAVLSILKGNPEDLVAAAGFAARDAASGDVASVRHCLVADCISRVMFLGEGFQAELDAIENGLGDLAREAAPCGVLTLGEISSRGNGYLEFFNKTCVVAVLHER